MYDSGRKDQETYSGSVTKKEQWVNIKIECLRGYTVPIITANLHEACSYDATSCTVARWFKLFQEGGKLTEDDVRTCCHSTIIDNISITIVSILPNEDWWLTV